MRTCAIVIILSGLMSCQNINKRHINTDIRSWSSINSWSFTGKMAINDGSNSGSGKISWKVEKNYFEAQFRAPLGHGSWKIQENNRGAQLSSSKNPDKFAENALILISDELGWNFPLEQLKYWLRGFHYLEKIHSLDSTVTSITDSGWEINYQKWESTPMGLVPIKIKASKPPYSVKLFIYKWNFD